MNPFDTVLINPILNFLILIYQGLAILHIPGALGVSIIVLTVIIRMTVWPLTTSQLKSAQKMAELKPHLQRIKEQHGKDKVRHQEEITKLYREHNVNPLAGCLPLLLQIPIFIALYQVLLKIVDLKSADFLSGINARLYLDFLHLDPVPSTKFLGLELFNKPNEWAQIGFLILLIPIITGVLQYIQSKMLMNPGNTQTLKKKETKDKKEGENMEDTMASMQSQMVYIMPAMIAFFSYGFPLGLSLYWNTFTIIGIIQQYKISGAGVFNKYLPKSLQK